MSEHEDRPAVDVEPPRNDRTGGDSRWFAVAIGTFTITLFLAVLIPGVYERVGRETYDGGSSCDGPTLVTKEITVDRDGRFEKVERRAEPNHPECR